MATAQALPQDDGGSLLKGLQDMPSPSGPPSKLQYLPSPQLHTLLSPLPAQPLNLMSVGGWGAGGVTPLNLPQLGLGLTPTPGSIPCLPLVSPGSTSALGLAALGLGGCTPGRPLEQLHVATDPLSLHCVKVNMLTVDVDEATMDQLMDEGRLHRPCLVTPGQLAHGRTARAANPLKSSSPSAASPPPLFVPVAGAGAPASVRLSLGGNSRRSLCGTKRSARPSSGGRPPSGIGAGKMFPPARAATSDTTASRDGSGSARSVVAAPADHELEGPAASASGSGSGSRPSSAGRSSGTAAGGAKEEGEGAPRLDLSVKFLEDNGYFDITLQAAAVQLGVGVTTLKKLCRQNGLGRWPYRARCSLRKLRDKMREYFATAPQEEREAADALMEREFGRLAQLNEGVIDDAVKQFRQAMFKLEFKARQQLESAARAAGKRPGSAGSEGELQAVIHSDPAIRTQAMLHLRRLLAACLDE